MGALHCTSVVSFMDCMAHYFFDMGGQCSELEELILGPEPFKAEDLAEYRKKQETDPPAWVDWIAPEVFQKFENKLINDRTACFKAIISTKEITKRPDYSIVSDDGRTSYDQALDLHEYAMDRMKLPKREISDRDELKINEKMFFETADVLETYHQLPEIKNMRDKFANLYFLKESLLYLVFLVILTTCTCSLVSITLQWLSCPPRMQGPMHFP